MSGQEQPRRKDPADGADDGLFEVTMGEVAERLGLDDDAAAGAEAGGAAGEGAAPGPGAAPAELPDDGYLAALAEGEGEEDYSGAPEAELAALAADPELDPDPDAPVTGGIFGRLSLDGGGLSLPLAEKTAAPAPREITAADLAALAETEAELDLRWPETKIEPSLDRIARLMDLLGHPERSCPVIHVAGTNGKTSTVRMIESLVRALGRRTGRTTSPHLQLVTERIAIDGEPLHPRDYVRIWAEIRPFVEMVDAESEAAGGPAMSKFEVLTAMAYAAFADAPVDVAVVETGMGGTWDATNVAEADVAVVTPIGLDHVDYLGDTLAEIAAEKAGIIKSRWDAGDLLAPPDNVAVIGEQDPEALRVLLERAVAVDAAVARAGAEYAVAEQAIAVGGQTLTLRGLAGVYRDIFLPLHGAHQGRNAATALAAVEAFFGAGPGRMLDPDAVREGFAAVTSPGRLERVRSAPAVLVDAAHNPHGAAALHAGIDAAFDFRRVVAVVAVLGDKDAAGILRELAGFAEEIVVTENSSPRALPVGELAETARAIVGEERVHAIADLPSAVELAIALAEETDSGDGIVSGAGVVITGSVVTAGEARTLFGKEPQ